MNYSKLSDFEINKAVAKSIGAVDVRQLKNMINEVYCEIDGMRSFKDFCNNPSDAWPIIIENEISIIPPISNGTNGWKAERFYNQNCGRIIDSIDKSPLRAAMIVYLMMQEQK